MRGELRGFTASGQALFRELSVGDDFSDLEFTYYDADRQPIDPTGLESRAAIRTVDVRLEAETSDPLSSGVSRSYTIRVSANPRNIETR